MKIKPIVEGHGDVLAVPELLRRLQFEYGLGGHEIQIARPIRWNRAYFNSELQVRRAVQLAREEADCAGIIIVIDSDDDCPKTYAARVGAWAAQELQGLPCEVVMAHREYETWFLPAIESMRGTRGVREDAALNMEPELVRGAKEKLEDCMCAGRSYSETTDQPALTKLADFATTYHACRSFRRLVSAFRSLLRSAGVQVGEFREP